MVLSPACGVVQPGMPGLQLYEDSRDNYKILHTLERHFGAIAGSPVPRIPQMLLPMFNALRLVWAISTHYSDDTHMCALLQRIAHALCERAQHSVMVQARPPKFALTAVPGLSTTIVHSAGVECNPFTVRLLCKAAASGYL